MSYREVLNIWSNQIVNRECTYTEKHGRQLFVFQYRVQFLVIKYQKVFENANPTSNFKKLNNSYICDNSTGTYAIHNSTTSNKLWDICAQYRCSITDYTCASRTNVFLYISFRNAHHPPWIAILCRQFHDPYYRNGNVLPLLARTRDIHPDDNWICTCADRLIGNNRVLIEICLLSVSPCAELLTWLATFQRLRANFLAGWNWLETILANDCKRSLTTATMRYHRWLQGTRPAATRMASFLATMIAALDQFVTNFLAAVGRWQISNASYVTLVFTAMAF